MPKNLPDEQIISNITSDWADLYENRDQKSRERERMEMKLNGHKAMVSKNKVGNKKRQTRG